MEHGPLTPEQRAELARLQQALPGAREQFVEAVRKSLSFEGSGFAVSAAAMETGQATSAIQCRIAEILVANDR
jgi:hypothetical protein